MAFSPTIIQFSVAREADVKVVLKKAIFNV